MSALKRYRILCINFRETVKSIDACKDMEQLWVQYSQRYIQARSGSSVSNEVLLDHVSDHIKADAQRVYLKYLGYVYESPTLQGQRQQAPNPKPLPKPKDGLGLENSFPKQH
eukprot:GHVU01092030.1.p1 GENE.GHVU01092030.1~~GHVU01092030.1.p1  ORF type:complete len:112 (-),score=4.51 GHVU01092030.1:228-563(-)